MNRSGVGARSLNIELQAALNPAGGRKVERARRTSHIRSSATDRKQGGGHLVGARPANVRFYLQSLLQVDHEIWRLMTETTPAVEFGVAKNPHAMGIAREPLTRKMPAGCISMGKIGAEKNASERHFACAASERQWRSFYLRVCPKTLGRIAEFSKHEAD